MGSVQCKLNHMVVVFPDTFGRDSFPSLKSEDTLEVDGEAVHGGRGRCGFVQRQLPPRLATRWWMKMMLRVLPLLPGHCRLEEVWVWHFNR